ncbi:MAG: putative Ig domain-containing protein, partial [Proteobacteria bacterium]|nr:putative Ig domain-containing protein [Pseudomonadota bacterium]
QSGDGDGCRLSGRPLAPSVPTIYRVRAVNDNGSSTFMLTITVNPAAPMLTPPVPLTFTTGVQDSFSLTNTGGGGLYADDASTPGCVLSGGTIPPGLRLTVSTDVDSSTCVLSGLPTVAQTAIFYMATATNATASSAVPVSITVVSGAPVIAMPTPLVFVVGTDIGTQAFANINTNSRTPDGNRAVARNNIGRVHTCTAMMAATGTTLPAGLSIAALSEPGTGAPAGTEGDGCVLTGNPTSPTAQGVYTVAVSNANGDSTLLLDILVNPAAPILTPPTKQTYATGRAIAPLTLPNTGGRMLNADSDSTPGCDVSVGDLPSGLSIAQSTDSGISACVISGMPDTVENTHFTVTATNVTASASVPVNIEIVSGTPAFTTPLLYTFTARTTIPPESLDKTNIRNDIGRVTACATATGDEPLPAGLVITALNEPGSGGNEGDGCHLSGTPSVPSATADYTVTVTNDNGDSTLTLTITVRPALPALTTPEAQVFATGGLASFTFTNTGGGMLNDNTATPPGCELTGGTLPSEISLAVSADGNSCTLSGTPTMPHAAGDITITATNITGSSATTTVSLAVVDGAAIFDTPDSEIFTDGIYVGLILYDNT